jgi:hypothetical protein
MVNIPAASREAARPATYAISSVSLVACESPLT